MKKYTEGSWEKTSIDHNGECYIYHPNHGTIALVTQDLIGQEANAQLISAAPDLLEALQDIVYQYERYYNNEIATITPIVDSIRIGRQIVAKALGKD